MTAPMQEASHKLASLLTEATLHAGVEGLDPRTSPLSRVVTQGTCGHLDMQQNSTDRASASSSHTDVTADPGVQSPRSPTEPQDTLRDRSPSFAFPRAIPKTPAAMDHPPPGEGCASRGDLWVEYPSESASLSAASPNAQCMAIGAKAMATGGGEPGTALGASPPVSERSGDVYGREECAFAMEEGEQRQEEGGKGDVEFADDDEKGGKDISLPSLFASAASI
jgi:hypothetical protein